MPSSLKEYIQTSLRKYQLSKVNIAVVCFADVCPKFSFDRFDLQLETEFREKGKERSIKA